VKFSTPVELFPRPDHLNLGGLAATTQTTLQALVDGNAKAHAVTGAVLIRQCHVQQEY
jgi:2C-methyl-D-erythritol 2,4-cyclodiphosphate synthase